MPAILKYCLLCLLPSVAALLVSCTGEEEDENLYAINFQTSDRAVMRSTEVNADNITDFRVWSAWTRADASQLVYMDGVKVEREDSSSPWFYSPVFYWPAEGTLDFYAYSPSVSSGVREFDALSGELSYDVTTDLERQEDFVVASVLHPAKNNAVRFDFKHILSRAKFEITNETGETIAVKTVEVKNLHRQGSYTAGTWTTTGNPVTAYTVPESEYLMVLPQTTGTTAVIVVTYDVGSGVQNVSKTFSFENFEFKQEESYTIYLVLKLA